MLSPSLSDGDCPSSLGGGSRPPRFRAIASLPVRGKGDACLGHCRVAPALCVGDGDDDIASLVSDGFAST
ncbi:UNVERIFIED_CONTAM: hypothetical protein Sradi_0733100 [Sesamum radiatum]|uniref:Uncharacterized protein n=1 Tax=Sesamum radiatum TaxID=300843 RepID=A0AAW2VRV0_SESRA